MRTDVIALIAAEIVTFAIAAAVANAQSAGAPYPVIQGKVYKFEQVADGVYYATGGLGGNHAIMVNDNDVLLVDDGSTPATARDLIADIKLLTDKPVRTVVNTHFHSDHTDGNSIFGPDVAIIGHEFVRTQIRTGDVLKPERIRAQIESLQVRVAAESDAARKAGLLKRVADWQTVLHDMEDVGLVPPNVTYSTRMILHRGSREIDLLFLGRGHTGGDTVVYLPEEKIVCTGDLIETQVAFMGDGYLDEWLTTLEALKQMDFALALPGHGHPFGNKALITAFEGYLQDVTAQVAVLRKQGVSPEDAAQRVDLTAYQKFFPDISGVGADLRGVQRIYQWMSEREKK